MAQSPGRVPTSAADRRKRRRLACRARSNEPTVAHDVAQHLQQLDPQRPHGRAGAESAADHGRRHQSRSDASAACEREQHQPGPFRRAPLHEGEPADSAVRYGGRHHEPARRDADAAGRSSTATGAARRRTTARHLRPVDATHPPIARFARPGDRGRSRAATAAGANRTLTVPVPTRIQGSRHSSTVSDGVNRRGRSPAALQPRPRRRSPAPPCAPAHGINYSRGARRSPATVATLDGNVNVQTTTTAATGNARRAHPYGREHDGLRAARSG